MNKRETKKLLERILGRVVDSWGSNLDLYEAGLKGANLREVDLEGASLVGANLEGANLEGANLSKVNFTDAELPEANLKGANLMEADLWGANLYRVNLEEACLEGAYLVGANLSKASLTGTNIISFQYQKDFSYAHYSKAYMCRSNIYARIGCEGHYLEQWLEPGFVKDLADKDGYADKQFQAYWQWIQLVKETLWESCQAVYTIQEITKSILNTQTCHNCSFNIDGKCLNTESPIVDIKQDDFCCNKHPETTFNGMSCCLNCSHNQYLDRYTKFGCSSDKMSKYLSDDYNKLMHAYCCNRWKLKCDGLIEVD